jgi:hypothetical protein
MADIDVVPKGRSHVWLWVVLAIVIALIIIWALAGGSTTTAPTTGELQQDRTPVVAQVPITDQTLRFV